MSFFSGLSTELISMIVERSEDEDLPSLRLTCKTTHDLATHRFAVRHMSERNHLVTKKSLQALVKITSHAKFGPYVKSILINTIRAKDPDIHDENLKHLKNLRAIFTNVAKGANTGITIGVTDNRPIYPQSACISREAWEKCEKPSYGWFQLLRGANGVLTKTPMAGWLVLEKLISMAINTGCKVDCLEARVVGFNAGRYERSDVEQLVGPLIDFHLISGCTVRAVFGKRRTSKTEQDQQPFTTVTYTPGTDLDALERLYARYSHSAMTFVQDVGICLRWYEGMGEWPLRSWSTQPDSMTVVYKDDEIEEVFYGDDDSGFRWVHPGP